MSGAKTEGEKGWLCNVCVSTNTYCCESTYAATNLSMLPLLMLLFSYTDTQKETTRINTHTITQTRKHANTQTPRLTTSSGFMAENAAKGTSFVSGVRSMRATRPKSAVGIWTLGKGSDGTAGRGRFSRSLSTMSSRGFHPFIHPFIHSSIHSFISFISFMVWW